MNHEEDKVRNSSNNPSKSLISVLLNHDEVNEDALTSTEIKREIQEDEEVVPPISSSYQQQLNQIPNTGEPIMDIESMSINEPKPIFSFRNSNHSQEEKELLQKFETEIMQNSDAIVVLTKLRLETKEKYLYQIRKYIRFCARQGYKDFIIKLDRVNSLLENEINKRGYLSENTVKSIRSPLNKLFYMNKIVYLSQQPEEYLGDNFIKNIMSKQLEDKTNQSRHTQHTQQPQPQQAVVNPLIHPQKLKYGDSNTNSGGSGNSSGNSTLFNLIDSNHSKSNTSTSTTSISSSNANKSLNSSTESNTPQSKLESLDQNRSIFEETIKGPPSTVSSSSTSESSPSKIFKAGDSFKHRITEEESKLLQKFNDEVLENVKTRDILSNLTGNTFKSYATDIKRFIRFCARKGKNDFLIEEEILTRFLVFETKKSKRNKIKNLRTSLLKLHQLNCLAYDLDFSEGDLIFIMNKFLDNSGTHNQQQQPQLDGDLSTVSNPITNANTENEDNTVDLVDEKADFVDEEDDEDNELVVKLKGYYQTTNILNGLSETSKKIYSNEFNRYALFCSEKLHLQNFNLTGETIKKFFIEDVIKRTPTISSKKLTEILSRFNRLHNLNVELNPSLPKTIENIEVVKQFLKEYGASNKGTNTNDVIMNAENLIESEDQPIESNTQNAQNEKNANRSVSNVGHTRHGGNGNGNGNGNGHGSGSGNGNGVETSSSSSTSRNGADTLSGASTSSAETSLPQLNYPNEPINQINVGSSSSDQASSGEITKSTRRKSGLAAAIPILSKPKPVFHSYSSRPEVFESTTSTTSSSSSGDKSADDKGKSRLQRVVEHQYEEQPQHVIDEPKEGSSNAVHRAIESRVEDDDDNDDDDGNEDDDDDDAFEFEDVDEDVDEDEDDDDDGSKENRLKTKDELKSKEQIKSLGKTYLQPHKSVGSKELNKRQKLEILPETSDKIPKFVMNRNIETITQLVEEWSLILKRNNKYNGIGWIKTIVDFQFYNNYKLIIELIEEVISNMDEKYKNIKIEQIIDNNIIYELASIFDEYLKRKKLTLDKFIKKCEQFPVYTKKEFLRILSRRKSNLEN
ncbi:uncharacterized protein KGF55_003663 [Candida pseudojiufengensis]|uniref:uncharacterized protein n=1 Tax=Candida pseudojiufengensis TaxID=497109 RepID=UPI002224FD74|nr:uncharacterized protein KGF55_003663 [Candida pseudojiufengensis]KAI5962587.1 hypothetical protein KGF55_003663 [Candida pseudojiufengensis]